MSRAFHRGAAVAITFKGAPVVFDRIRPRLKTYQLVHLMNACWQGLGCTAYARFGNQARQTKKGPITRFGVTQ